MRTTIKTLALLSLLSGMGQAAITISGTVGTSFKGSDGTTNIPVGSLFMVIVDTGVTGFLEGTLANPYVGVTPGSGGLTTTADPDVVVAQASITAGQTFAGDTILATGAVTSAGVMPTLLSSIAIAGYESAKFAVIWFAKSSATLASEGLANQYYGAISGADWTLPASDAGTFTMSPTDAAPSTNYYSFSSVISAAQVGANGFFTGSGTAGDATTDIKAATFQVIPEPSAALLGAIGALGLLRRRRN
jgi:hypothetical protein